MTSSSASSRAEESSQFPKTRSMSRCCAHSLSALLSAGFHRLSRMRCCPCRACASLHSSAHTRRSTVCSYRVSRTCYPHSCRGAPGSNPTSYLRSSRPWQRPLPCSSNPEVQGESLWPCTLLRGLHMQASVQRNIRFGQRILRGSGNYGSVNGGGVVTSSLRER